MKKRTTDTRVKYGNMVFQYIYKRNALREEYHPWRSNPEYLERVKPINKKLERLRQAIKCLDAYTNKLDHINSMIREYYNLGMNRSVTNLRNLKVKTPGKLYLLRKMFSKYAIEQNVPGSYVSKYVGWKDITQASRYRLELTRAMQHDDILKQQWHKFKKFMDRVPQQKTA